MSKGWAERRLGRRERSNPKNRRGGSMCGDGSMCSEVKEGGGMRKGCVDLRGNMTLKLNLPFFYGNSTALKIQL